MRHDIAIIEEKQKNEPNGEMPMSAGLEGYEGSKESGNNRAMPTPPKKTLEN